MVDKKRGWLYLIDDKCSLKFPHNRNLFEFVYLKYRKQSVLSQSIFTLISERQIHIQDLINWKFNKDNHASKNQKLPQGKSALNFNAFKIFSRYRTGKNTRLKILLSTIIKFYHLPTCLLYQCWLKISHHRWLDYHHFIVICILLAQNTWKNK